jgi:hypothetical protein
VREYEVFVVLASILAIELWRARASSWTWRRRLWLLSLAALVGSVGVYLGCVRVYIKNWDYLNGYYHAGRLVLEGAAQQFYHRDTPGKAAGFVNMPIISLLYVPLALLSPRVSVLVNGALGVAVAALTLHLLVRHTSARTRTLVAILFLSSGPLWYSITMGNVAHFLLLPMYGVFVLSARRRDVLLGMLLALMVIIKPYLLILVAYFTLRRRFRIIASFLMTGVAVFAASVAIFGIALNAEWLHFLQRMSGGPLSGYNNQSLNGFLVRLLEVPDLFGDAPQVPTAVFRAAKLVVMAAVLGALGWVFVRVKPPQSRAEEWLEIAIVLTLGTITAPISWTYYYALLLIPVALYARGDLPLPRVRGSWPMVLAVALIMPPVQSAYSGGLRKVLYERLVISHYFLGGMLLFWVLLCARLLAERARMPDRYPRAAPQALASQ